MSIERGPVQCDIDNEIENVILLKYSSLAASKVVI